MNCGRIINYWPVNQLNVHWFPVNYKYFNAKWLWICLVADVNIACCHDNGAVIYLPAIKLPRADKKESGKKNPKQFPGDIKQSQQEKLLLFFGQKKKKWLKSQKQTKSGRKKVNKKKSSNRKTNFEGEIKNDSLICVLWICLRIITCQ